MNDTTRYSSLAPRSSLLTSILLSLCCVTITACSSSKDSNPVEVVGGTGGTADTIGGSGNVAGTPGNPQGGNGAGGRTNTTAAEAGGSTGSGGTLAGSGGAISSSGGKASSTAGSAGSSVGHAGATAGGAVTASGGAGTSLGGKAGATSGGTGPTSGGAGTAGASGSSAGEASTIIGHQNTDVRKIPASVITEVKSRFHIGYAHTSHGSQIVTGMGTLQSYAPFGTTYAFSSNGATGLHFDDGMSGGCGSDLSTCNDNSGEPAWLAVTRTYLANHPTTNVIMWAWCSISGHNITAYLNGMETLIGEYGPGGTNARAATTPVTFIFMTGHSEGSNRVPATSATQIRQHCVDHQRWLIDYYDIESHDMAGRSYDALEIADNLAYSGGNWAQEYITSASADATLKALTEATSGCAHSDSPSEANLNCVLKSQAFWWTLARIAGWNGK